MKQVFRYTGCSPVHQQIGALIAAGQIHFVIFLRDPLTAQPHEPDVQALLRLCDVHKIPFATNITTAEIMISYLNRLVGDHNLK